MSKNVGSVECGDCRRVVIAVNVVCSLCNSLDGSELTF